MATIIAQFGSRGGAASEINQILSALGYKTIASDTFDNQTKTSVESFQIDYGLPVTGVADSDTYAVLRSVYKARFPQLQITQPVTATPPASVNTTTPATVTQTTTAGAPVAPPAVAAPVAPPAVAAPVAPPAVAAPSAAASVQPRPPVPAPLPPEIVPRATLRLGVSGPLVRQLQEKLFNLGYFTGMPDGIFGQETFNAVRSFQYSHGLTPDGVVGSKTWLALGYYADGTSTQADEVIKPTIRRGDRGVYVKELQEKLSSFGFFTGAIDGVFGAATAAALQRFQRSAGLTDDGVCGKNTWAVLDNYSPGVPSNLNYPTVRPGDSGNYVIELQQRLSRLGYYKGVIDGRYGPGTEAAVRKFQVAYGLGVDGIVGSATWSVLVKL
jgi:peptidoglycan hydrolase-like protein with peptidoglycan-binding domain